MNSQNKIDTLTLDQLKGIFSGVIKNWKEVGGDDIQIVLYGRENSSGTYEYFKQSILGEDQYGKKNDYATSTQVLQGTAALGEAVSEDIKGIGYGGVGYFVKRNDLKVLYLKKDDFMHAVSPMTDNGLNSSVIRDGIYPLSRFLYCYTNGEPKGAAKDFINFILSKKGQQIVKLMEYLPLEIDTNLEAEN